MKPFPFLDQPHAEPGLRRAIFVGSNSAMLALLWSVRHDTTEVALLVGLHLLRVVVNALARRHVGDGAARPSTQITVAVLNVALSLTISHVARWPLAALLFVPLQAAIIGSFGARARSAYATIHLGSAAVVMALDGLDAFSILITCGAAFTVYLALDARWRLLERTLRCLAEEHDRLAQMHAELALVHTQLRQRDRLTSLGVLAAGVAHEINNPMTYVTSNVSLLLEDLPRFAELPNEVRRDYIEDLLPATLDGIQRVNAIVGDLRRFARGDIEEEVDYDLSKEIASAVRICRHCFVSGPSLTVDVIDLPKLRGRPRQMCQVIVNLLVNAAQATQGGGSVTLSVTRSNDATVIEVTDTGRGMSEATRQRVFEPFFTTKEVGEGTGLGLSVVHGIIAAHGGSVEVRSAPDQGTTMRVTLPLEAAESSRARVVAASPRTRPALGASPSPAC